MASDKELVEQAQREQPERAEQLIKAAHTTATLEGFKAVIKALEDLRPDDRTKVLNAAAILLSLDVSVYKWQGKA